MQLIEVQFINPWLVGEKIEPIIICDADEALHFEPILFLEKRADLDL